MAQQNLTVNGNAVFQGSLTGTTSLGSQPIGSGTVILLPNSTPVALGQIHRRLDAALAVRDLIDPQRHLHRGQRAQQHRLVQIAEMPDAEYLAPQLAQPTAQRNVEAVPRGIAH